ncbi:hypothetical protein [Nannocystis bainbridge]|uniref:Lipoprotein n=1 Tax=Nannocystis bainbridge TaxID=2995303 RepID=A0ABT5E9Q2_9BACT|nr:hypothetical protein [Nannocystis bainbridge]MDC0722587.1 hypothetical protein [Nannocystis bainbridge]
MIRLRRVFGVTTFAIAGFMFGCFAEDGGECSAGAPCARRGEACDDTTKTCELQELDVEGTGANPAPATFTATLPFFRGTVCAATNVKPGDKIPVKIEMCVDPCVSSKGHKFKSQYRCSGTSCEAALVVYLPDAVGANCPAQALGKFPKANCEFITIEASAGPLSTANTGPITGTATLELPFLTNEDAKLIAGTDNGETVWQTIYKYPQDAGRVFQLSMNPSNQPAPPDCKDASKCTCKDIGF